MVRLLSFLCFPNFVLVLTIQVPYSSFNLKDLTTLVRPFTIFYSGLHNRSNTIRNIWGLSWIQKWDWTCRLPPKTRFLTALDSIRTMRQLLSYIPSSWFRFSTLFPSNVIRSTLLPPNLVPPSPLSTPLHRSKTYIKLLSWSS